MSSMTAPSEYVLKPLREGADFTLYRGRQHRNPSPVLAIALTAEHPSPESLRRLEHEYSLAAELDPAWAVKPLALTRHEGRTLLILKDPGGEPLDRILERDQGQPLDLTRFLHIAIGLAAALGQVHRRGLIHKDIKPANVLVDDAGAACRIADAAIFRAYDGGRTTDSESVGRLGREFVRLTKRAEFIDGVNFLALCHQLNHVCFNECGEWKISELRSVQIGRLVS
jgi:serine/threonine protein kinase